MVNDNTSSSSSSKHKLLASMALLQNIFGCFTESSESKYICHGDVCVLRNQKKPGKKNMMSTSTNNKPKQSNRNFLAILSVRRASTT
ncbi:hypothetical protein ERO13_D01G068000v2 [Gossypium hirsutum]|uniref:Uncharacterized protein n=3 Tax=Gossypium TaxID=3633 RepID=A0A5J5SLR9_GOSBA|nr:hypothetical protein ES319_D01G083500v1 [Gossypium barbadense]KAG4161627.1 hypothetical protein ERO13_D01G068000v2 [Gossypium hirsutum]TYH87065.1 hypothetical protein ES332_D01G089700v1 [Gossypium tomentosum]TYI96662.1 hypothetical protein E1A91_D01G089100v1 [Gossypium mustelinum]